jgi:serine protease
MFKRIFAVAAAASLSVLGGTAAAQAQAQSHARPAGHLHGVRVVNLHGAYEARLGHVKPGKIAGIVYARGHRPKAAAKNAAATCAEPACPLVYSGGPVQLTPKVYLLLWGPNWSKDSSQQASANYLESFYSGLGDGSDDIWSPITSQYGDSSGNPAFPASVLAGVIQDTSAPPTGATQTQLAAEADTSAAKFGITDLADAQIVVATQSGTCPLGFDDPACGSNAGAICGWHSSSNEPYINLPYLPDAGTACGQDFVNTDGVHDGFSLVGGDEYADTITNPSPTGSTTASPGWVDTADTVSGGEIADKCAFGQSFSASAPDTDMALSTGSFAMQPLWSNAVGGCAMSNVAKDTVTLTSPGSQSGTVNNSVNLQLAATSSGSFLLTYFTSGLPTGLSINSHTGLISGTLSAAGTFSVTVRARDETGASHSVSFTWTVAGVTGKPIKGDHGKCLDDFGGGTTNGNKVDIWTCNNTASQQWTFVSGELSVLGKCLDDSSQGGAGAKLVVWTCNGHAAQTWRHKSNGEYVLKLNGLCMTDPSGSATNGTQVVIRKCSAFADQTWTLP